MKTSDFLAYSSKEPMTILRKKFHSGECLDKTSPQSLSASDALEDVLYTQYVFENAYSGYAYHDKALFDHAFRQILASVRGVTAITPRQLIDLICEQLTFICDGHLALTTSDYGKGFYQRLQTYVAQMRVVQSGGAYYAIDSGEQVCFNETVRAFPTIGNDGRDVCLLGVRSKTPVEALSVQISGRAVLLPLHRIMSEKPAKESLLDEHYEGEIAVITCSSFVGDSDEALNKLYEAGKKCRNYRHVVWNLSNNSGGNSEFPKRFLSGLYGRFSDPVKTLALQSTLVHAKETSEQKAVPYRFSQAPEAPAYQEKCKPFCGALHVILNDGVASSAELALAWAAAYPRVTFYGCSSLGIGRFGDLCIYYLPHSQIALWCPQKVFDAGIQETIGFEPDFWVDSGDVVSAVLDALPRG